MKWWMLTAAACWSYLLVADALDTQYLRGYSARLEEEMLERYTAGERKRKKFRWKR